MSEFFEQFAIQAIGKKKKKKKGESLLAGVSDVRRIDIIVTQFTRIFLELVDAIWAKRNEMRAYLEEFSANKVSVENEKERKKIQERVWRSTFLLWKAKEAPAKSGGKPIGLPLSALIGMNLVRPPADFDDAVEDVAKLREVTPNPAGLTHLDTNAIYQKFVELTQIAEEWATYHLEKTTAGNETVFFEVQDVNKNKGTFTKELNWGPSNKKNLERTGLLLSTAYMLLGVASVASVQQSYARDAREAPPQHVEKSFFKPTLDATRDKFDLFAILADTRLFMRLVVFAKHLGSKSFLGENNLAWTAKKSTGRRASRREIGLTLFVAGETKTGSRVKGVVVTRTLVIPDFRRLWNEWEEALADSVLSIFSARGDATETQLQAHGRAARNRAVEAANSLGAYLESPESEFAFIGAKEQTERVTKILDGGYTNVGRASRDLVEEMRNTAFGFSGVATTSTSTPAAAEGVFGSAV